MGRKTLRKAAASYFCAMVAEVSKYVQCGYTSASSFNAIQTTCRRNESCSSVIQTPSQFGILAWNCRWHWCFTAW